MAVEPKRGCGYRKIGGTYLVSDSGEVRLGIPLALLPPGDYSLRLLRKEKGGWQRVQDHRFEIQQKPRRRPQRW